MENKERVRENEILTNERAIITEKETIKKANEERSREKREITEGRERKMRENEAFERRSNEEGKKRE